MLFKFKTSGTSPLSSLNLTDLDSKKKVILPHLNTLEIWINLPLKNSSKNLENNHLKKTHQIINVNKVASISKYHCIFP